MGLDPAPTGQRRQTQVPLRVTPIQPHQNSTDIRAFPRGKLEGMKKYAPLLAFLFVLICIFAVWSPASIIQAIIPQVVPTPNKQGNGTKFQLSTGATTTNDCVKYDANGNTVDAGAACGSGGGGGAGTTFFSSTTQAGPSNTAAETSVIGTVTGSTTIPANTFANGTFLQVSADGYFTTPVTSDALTIRLKCGSTVLGSATLTPTINTTNGTFRLNLGITGIGTGASGAFITNGRFELTGVANPSSSQNAKVLNTTNVPFDFTTACAMDVTAQFAGATAGESITGTNVAAWLPGAAAGGGNTIATGTCATLPTSGQTNRKSVQMHRFPAVIFFHQHNSSAGLLSRDAGYRSARVRGDDGGQWFYVCPYRKWATDECDKQHCGMLLESTFGAECSFDSVQLHY